jgi:transcriptional antiterminator Rof (Rho-off)
MEYKQISCSLYDRLESLAVSKKPIEITYISNENNSDLVQGYIQNIFSESNSEFLIINDIKIRLDKIQSIIEK